MHWPGQAEQTVTGQGGTTFVFDASRQASSRQCGRAMALAGRRAGRGVRAVVLHQGTEVVDEDGGRPKGPEERGEDSGEEGG